MWANILFALLTLLPVASCLVLPQPSWHKSLAAFFYSHFVLSVSLPWLFFSLSLSLSLCSACCSDKNLNNSPNVPSWNVKIPNDFSPPPPSCSPLFPLPCRAEVGKRRALFPVWRNWSHDCQMIANEWQRMTANVTPGYVDVPSPCHALPACCRGCDA